MRTSFVSSLTNVTVPLYNIKFKEDIKTSCFYTQKGISFLRACPQTMWRCSVVVSMLASINVVNRHWAWLVLGWVTVCGRVKHLCNKSLRSTQPSNQLPACLAMVKVGCVHLCRVKGNIVGSLGSVATCPNSELQRWTIGSSTGVLVRVAWWCSG